MTLIERIQTIIHTHKLTPASFADKIKLLNLENSIEFLSFVESDNFQKTVEEWPKDKFEKNLYVQIEINKIDIATKLLKSYLKKIQSDFVLAPLNGRPA